ncbi:MAG: hypothetical protein WKF77_06240 [Planctomycetaceae bacterium]
MNIHPYANLFPMQSDEEIQALADDISKHGLRQLIVIDEDEMILDGRNRSLACVIAQVKPTYEPFVGNDAAKLAYVVSVNVHRRHLTTAQRAEIAAKIATMSVGANQHTGKKKKEGSSNDPPSKPVSTEQAAKMMNVSPASVKRAKAQSKPAKSKPAAQGKPKATVEPLVAPAKTEPSPPPKSKPKPADKSPVAKVPKTTAKAAKLLEEITPARRARMVAIVSEEMKLWPASVFVELGSLLRDVVEEQLQLIPHK